MMLLEDFKCEDASVHYMKRSKHLTEQTLSRVAGREILKSMAVPFPLRGLLRSKREVFNHIVQMQLN